MGRKKPKAFEEEVMIDDEQVDQVLEQVEEPDQEEAPAEKPVKKSSGKGIQSHPKFDKFKKGDKK